MRGLRFEAPALGTAGFLKDGEDGAVECNSDEPFSCWHFLQIFCKSMTNTCDKCLQFFQNNCIISVVQSGIFEDFVWHKSYNYTTSHLWKAMN